jgi:hypothetical protein
VPPPLPKQSTVAVKSLPPVSQLPALRDPRLGRFPSSVGDHSCCEKASDQLQNTPIADLIADHDHPHTRSLLPTITVAIPAMLPGSGLSAHGRREKEHSMKFKLKGAPLAGLLVLALALGPPAFAQVRPTTLSDSQEPGSVIVFPKFLQGTTQLTEGPRAPMSELEIGVVCPKGATCSKHQPVKIRFHWVCGTSETDLAGIFVCKETDFDITATVFESIVLTPNGETAGFYTPGLPTKFALAPPCPAGYLIGWVINPANDQPVKFDGLIGDAHIRAGLLLGSYNAIPIQADPGLDTFPAANSVITTDGNGALMFDGAPGHYLAVTGQVAGDVRYPNLTTGPFTTGFLTLLTLDVKSNIKNNPVFVDLDFFGGNPSAIGNENQLSTSTKFICWEEIPLTTINPGLTTTTMGRKGVFVSAPAVKVGIQGIMDETGPTTLLGLSWFVEFGGGFGSRASYSNLFNISVPIPTHFLPTPSPNFLP